MITEIDLKYLDLVKLFTRYVQPILKLNVNIDFIFNDLVDDVDSLTEDDLKSIAIWIWKISPKFGKIVHQICTITNFKN